MAWGGGVATGGATVTVTGANDTPRPQPDLMLLGEDSPATSVNLQLNDQDVDL